MKQQGGRGQQGQKGQGWDRQGGRGRWKFSAGRCGDWLIEKWHPDLCLCPPLQGDVRRVGLYFGNHDYWQQEGGNRVGSTWLLSLHRPRSGDRSRRKGRVRRGGKYLSVLLSHKMELLVMGFSSLCKTSTSNEGICTGDRRLGHNLGGQWCRQLL